MLLSAGKLVMHFLSGMCLFLSSFREKDNPEMHYNNTTKEKQIVKSNTNKESVITWEV